MTKEICTPLVFDMEELDVWLRGFWGRLESYALDPVAGELKGQFITHISHVVAHCLANNVSHTFTTNFDSARRATNTTCRFSIDSHGLCFDLALAGFHAGATMERNVCSSSH